MKAQTVSLPIAQKWAIPETALVLGVTLLIPFLVHLIPFSGSAPLGAHLLPFYYAPFVALFLFRWHVAFIAAVAAPIINFALTGMPEWSLVLLLSLELGLFIGWVTLLKNNKILKWICAPLALVLAKAVSSALIGLFPIALGSMDYFAVSVSTALPGLALLLAINILVIKFYESRS
jgi:hypothetical protein